MTIQFLLKVAGEPGDIVVKAVAINAVAINAVAINAVAINAVAINAVAINAVAINAVVISEAANVVVSPEGANSIDDLIYVMVNP